MSISERDRALRRAFRFDAADLAANRAGRVSPRQDALLRAGRLGMQLSLAMFAAVMLGTVGFVVFFDRRLLTPEGPGGVWIPAAVALLAIAAGLAGSRRYLAAAGARKVLAADGPVEILADAPGDCRIRLGATSLRLPGVEAVEAFEPGHAYRVYYVAGPVALVLSAESLAGRPSGIDPAADAEAEAEERETARAQIGIVRRGYVVVGLIGLLALGIPLGGFFVRDLAAPLRPVAWAGLLVAAVAFVSFAVRWLNPTERRRG
jgi:hypothetical protein